MASTGLFDMSIFGASFDMTVSGVACIDLFARATELR
jgi:hypothetical protein